MFMCFAAGIVGVLVFLRKQSLLGETLSHATYPGVILGVVAAASLSLTIADDTLVSIAIMTGAFITAVLGLVCVQFLERRLAVRSDAALCFVLSAFFGIGLTLASRIQFEHPVFYRRVQGYLYGQAATMTDWHIGIYALLSLIVVAVITLFYKELQLLIFDREYGKSVGVKIRFVDALAFILTVSAVVIGIRSVGVVLMSAMLIAPAAAARQFSHRLSVIFFIAGFIGLVSGFLGNYFSVEVTAYLAKTYPNDRLSLPTGPMIVVVASLFCVLALIFAPERGLFPRQMRIARFRYKTLCENILKQFWRNGFDKELPFFEIAKFQHVSGLYLRWVLTQLIHNGWLMDTPDGNYKLTTDGFQWASRIVRLHRLWEVYLTEALGVGADRVHRNAEEMEHIITPELEEELTLLLDNPKRDPHHQPIPPKEEL
jgi:manganese/zinc/iron transport system permease protein